VRQLLENLTDIEQLFSSRKLLFSDFPYCASPEFQQKVNLAIYIRVVVSFRC